MTSECPWRAAQLATPDRGPVLLASCCGMLFVTALVGQEWLSGTGMGSDYNAVQHDFGLAKGPL